MTSLNPLIDLDEINKDLEKLRLDMVELYDKELYMDASLYYVKLEIEKDEQEETDPRGDS